MIKNLDHCYAEGVREHFLSLAVDVPASQFGKGQSRLATTAVSNLRTRMTQSGSTLGELCGGILGWGVKTGLNDAFIISQVKRDELVAATPAAAEIIKPLIEGDNVRRFEIQYRGWFLIYTYHGIDISRYPSVEAHLRPFRKRLDARATKQEWFELQQPQMAYREYFAQPKIVYPDIGKELRFAVDEKGFFGANTTYFLPLSDWFICAVMNSSSVRRWIEGSLNDLRGGYLRFFGQHMEQIPIPNASAAEKKAVGELAKKVQALHGQRRARVERFLRDLGLDPAQSTSRNPLEQPWSLSAAEFAKRAKRQPAKLHESARDETAALTEQIAKLEAEIDARVATLYGLDAEDRRWAAQAATSAKPDDKQSLFFRVLGKLKERRPYFRLDEIQTLANDEELALKDSSLSVYLSEAVKQGHIHDAGRGWYSSLPKAFELESRPVKSVVHSLGIQFPLLDFTVWSTEQIRAYGHHLLARFVTFVHTDRDSMPSVAEFLKDAGYDVHLNPRANAAKQFAIREKTVVIRPKNNAQPHHEHQVTIEGLLVELFVESRALNLMDASECYRTFENLASQSRLSIGALLDYARERRPAALEFMELINAEFNK